MSAAGGAPLIAMMGTSALGSVATGYSEAQALKATGKYEAGIAKTNAAMADLAGEQTLEAGDAAASRKNLETKMVVGSERASQGASGVDVGGGSAALVRGGTQLAGSVDELTIRNNAARRAFGYKVQADQERFQGQFSELTAKSQAKQSLLAGGLGAISGPLGIYGSSLRYSRYFNKGTGVIPNDYI